MDMEDEGVFFEQMDTQKVGYVTATQIQDLYEALYMSPVSPIHVDAAISQICGGHRVVSRHQFIDVLQEIERRQTIHEQAYWDFKALDVNGDDRISLKDALLLFQDFHSENFSMQTWNDFLKSRAEMDADVCFDELYTWLCALPSGESYDDAWVESEKQRMGDRQQEYMQNKYHSLEQEMDDDADDLEDMRRGAKRKLNKWNRYGVGAVLFDDDEEDEEDHTHTVKKSREWAGMSDLLDVLDTKYSLLQDKLLFIMATHAAAGGDEDIQEIYKQLKAESSRLPKGQGQEDKVKEMSGSRALLDDSVQEMMGEVGGQLEARYRDQEALVLKLKAEGKSGKALTDAVRQHYHSSLPGPVTCGEALIHLSKRKQSEKTSHLKKIQASSSAMLSVYASLSRQCVLLAGEQQFDPAALSVGLAERSPAHSCPGYDWDRTRSESLAGKRLEERTGRRPQRSNNVMTEADSEDGRLDLQVGLVTELENKQHLERELMIYLLQGHDTQAAVSAALKMKPIERKRRVGVLRNQHQTWRETCSVGQTPSTVHQQLLQEGVALYWASKLDSLKSVTPNLTDQEVAISVLADLQRAQEVEFEIKIQTLANKTSRELCQLIRRESRGRVLEHCDNVAYVVLGAVDVGPEEKEYLEALNLKYSALRDAVLTFALRDKHGTDWIRFSEERKRKELHELQKMEKSLRGEGKFEEMASIIGTKAKTLPDLSSLLGEAKSFLQPGGGAEQDAPVPPVNLLADLVSRQDTEQDNLVSWLKSPATHDMSVAARRLQLLLLHLETRCAQLETDYETALLATGLLERLETEKKSGVHVERQNQLAARRVSLRRQQLKQGQGRNTGPGKSDPPKGDVFVCREAYIQEVYNRHVEERTALLNLLLAESLRELLETASSDMSHTERVHRLSELRAKRNKLSLSQAGDRDDYADILEEAAAIQMVCKTESLKKSQGKSYIDGDKVITALLVCLQEMQDTELNTVLSSLENQSKEGLLQLWKKEAEERSVRSWSNVFSVLTSSEGEVTEREIVQMVEMKYVKLRETLLQLCGQSDGPQDNHSALVLQAKEQALWAKGDTKGLSELVAVTLPAPVDMLMGQDREKFYRWVADNNTDTGSKPMLMQEEEEKKESYPAADLLQRFIKEKAFVSTMLNSPEMCGSPTSSSVLLCRLYREGHMMSALTDSAASFPVLCWAVGLAERQENIRFRLRNDRERYINVASAVWAQREERQKGSKPIDVIKSSDETELMKSMVRLLQRCHDEEVHVFLTLLTNQNTELQVSVSLSTQQQRTDQLAEIQAQYKALSPDNMKRRLELLRRAAVVCTERRRVQLPQDAQTDENVAVSLLADLLTQHNQHAEVYLHNMADMDVEALTTEQTKLKRMGDGGWYDNIATVLFRTETLAELTDEALIQAVEEKYDALNDKLLIEALINQLGETNWLRLSEEERQRHLVELKLKQRQLKKAGLLDEAAALLGDLERNKESLQQLLGESQEEQQRRLRDKIERRRQRLAEGKTEAECEEMEREEEQREEEERRKQNILQQLQNRIDQEKDELMRQLMESGNQEEKERDRQMALTKLRLQQRQIRQEDKFDTAALMLGLAEEQGEKVKSKQDEERLRQERLAKERLEAARRRREAGDKTSLVGGSTVDVDVDDVADTDLMLVLMELLDRKHREERAIFIQCDTMADKQSVKTLGTSDLESRLQELAGFREGWRTSASKDPQQQFAIFKEAMACVLELRSRQSESADTDHQVALLADLQQAQQQDLSLTLMRVQQDDSAVLREEMRQVALCIETCLCDNIAKVLGLVAPSQTPEQEVMKELDLKYDALRDKLLIEALMKQYGHLKWAQLSEQERQTHLLEARLKQRRLQRADRRDELNMVLGQYLQDKTDLEKMLSESRGVQQQRLEERMRRRRQLREERETEGLSADEEELDKLLDQEEQKQQQEKNVLLTLETQYEAEKAALLSNLKAKEDSLAQDRERQAAIARLRRDQKLLQQEENLDSACLIFSMGQQAGEQKEQSFAREQELQKQLALQRMNALKNKRNKAVNEQDPASIVSHLEKMQKRSDGPPGEVLLVDMDERHREEREVLVQLLHAASTDTAHKKQAHKVKDVQDLKKELAGLHQEHSKWLTRCRQSVRQESLVSPQDTAQRRAHQFKRLTHALVYRMEVENRVSGRKPTEDELGVQILSDLQLKQSHDASILNSQIAKQDPEFLSKLCELQTTSRREGWYDNLTGVLFLVGDGRQTPDSQDSSELGTELNTELEASEQQMEQEFEQKKKDVRERAAAEGVDPDTLLKEIIAEQEAKRQVMLAEHERQRQAVRDRLEERRRISQNREFEAAAAAQLIKIAGTQSQAVTDSVKSEQGRQTSILQKKIEARRQARRLQLEGDTGAPAGLTSDLPDGPLRAVSPLTIARERSGLGTEVSEDNKKAVTLQLVRQQENLEKRKIEERERQEQMVKRRIEQKRGKLSKEAADLYTLGERQKTILEQSQKDERDRQLSMIVERKNRVMFERTKTQRSMPSREDSEGFESMLKGAESNMSKDEQMEMTARKLQDKFQLEAKEQEETSGGGLMDDKARFQQLKARKLQRKKAADELKE